MEKTENTHFLDSVVDALRKAATELEELQVQANLGKAEASEKYEEWKKEFSSFMHNAKNKARKGTDNIKNVQEEITALFEELRVQLALGKADGFEAFKAQKKKILEKIRAIENKIRNNATLNKIYAVFLVQMEKFKVFLEWLEQKWQEGKASASEKFEEGKVKFNEFVDTVKNKFEEMNNDKWEHFQEEVAQAFTNFKNAFVKA